MKRSLAFLALLLLAFVPSGHKSTNLNQPTTFIRGSDGYIFERKEYENTDLHIKIVQHPDLMSLWKSLGKIPGSNDNWTMAYTLHDGYGNCTIHIVDQAKAYEPEFLGHELSHCIYGNFHEHQDVGQ